MEAKYYQNKSGQLFFLNSLNRKIGFDPNVKHRLTDGEISQEPILPGLIANGSLVEVCEDSDKASVSQSPSVQTFKNVPVPRNRTNVDLAEPIGGPYTQVSLNPDGMSRLRDYQEPPKHSDIAVDPSRMSRYVDTQQSLQGSMNPPPIPVQSGKVPPLPSGMMKNAGITPPGSIFISSPNAVNAPQNAVYAPPQQKKAALKNSSPEIYWNGPANDAGGYGKMNRHCVEGLFKKGVSVQLDLFKIPDFRSAVPITESMNEMINTVVSEDAPSVWAVMPQKYLPRSGRKIVYSMLETSEVPDSFLDKCKMADELWVPSKFNMEAFEKRDLGNLELVHMPLGVDTEMYKPMELTAEQKSLVQIKTKGFVFLSLFGWSARKGTDVLFKSYLREFNGNDDVTLVVVSRKDGSTSTAKIQEIRDDIHKYIKTYCPDPSNPPYIVHIGDAMSEEVLPVLYNMADCFCLPSRGEGFGLPYCEAGSCGLPVIATRCCGQMDFLTDENSFLIDIEGYKVAGQEIRCLSSYYENAPFAVLGEKAVDQCREYMRFVIDNNSEAKKRAGILRKDLESNFTWDHLVDKVYGRLRSF